MRADRAGPPARSSLMALHNQHSAGDVEPRLAHPAVLSMLGAAAYWALLAGEDLYMRMKPVDALTQSSDSRGLYGDVPQHPACLAT